MVSPFLIEQDMLAERIDADMKDARAPKTRGASARFACSRAR